MNYQPLFNPMQNIDPTGAMVAGIGHQAVGAARDFFADNAEWKARKQKFNDDLQFKSDIFLGAVKLMNDSGINPQGTGLPDFKQDMTPEDYAKKVSTTVQQAFVIKALEADGADTAELRKSMQFPDVFNQQAETLQKGIMNTKIEDLTKKITGAYGPDIYREIRRGQMSIDEINKRYGSRLTEDEYNRIAGIQAPQPLPGFTPKAQAAADQPMDYDRAAKETSIAQPLPYTQAQQKVMTSGLPAERMQDLAPVLTAAANRSTADIYKGMEKPTEAGLYMGKLSTGESVDEGTKALGAAIRAEDATAQKAKYNQMREKEQEVSLLKAYMQDWKNRQQFKKDYGDDAITAIDTMHKLFQEKADLQNEMAKAQNWREFDKTPPDIQALQAKDRAIQNQIDELIGRIPNLKDMADKVSRAPTELTPPEINPQPRVDKKPAGGLEDQAKQWLVSRGNLNPTPQQIQRVMVKLQDKMNAGK
jgi:hypothetical protein